MQITGSMLYDFVACPHRVAMDAFGDYGERDEPNPFVQLLWERGALHEAEVMQRLEEPYLDLSDFVGDEKTSKTLQAIKDGEPLIFGGRLEVDNLLGEPDLLRKEADGYSAGDIKSGAGFEGKEDHSKPKKHYAVQLGLYTDTLERLGFSGGRCAFIWDIEGEEVAYDFTELYGKQNPHTLWEDYKEVLAQAEAIVGKTLETRPAYSGVCKLCHWYTACTKRLENDDDLTLIPELGRAKRDVMLKHVSTVQALAKAETTTFIEGKKTIFPRIGPATLEKFSARAKLLSAGKDARPYLRAPIDLPNESLELFFDIEDDPMRDIVYLHGFVERRDGDATNERYVYFLAEEPTEACEERVFSEAVQYMQECQPCAIYYYASHEKTTYGKLLKKYPGACDEDDLTALYESERTVDLYNDIVRKATEWPTWDHGLKTLAKYLGFEWRDTHPSGAASIEWYDRWVRTGDPEIRQRILDYNEDDCRATRFLVDGIRGLPKR